MIKIFSGLYIHFLTVVLVVICFITNKTDILFITYLIMFIHELAHLLAAKIIGLKISYIVFFPFAVNLKLKNKLVYSLTDEIILYMSGPFSNILMATVAKVFFKNCFWFDDFYYRNIALFIINLLPILPLDGGVVLRKIIAWHFGYGKSIIVMRILSIFMFSGAIVLAYNVNGLRYNFSFIFFVIFLVGNIFMSKEKYNVDLLREVVFSDKKIKRRKAKLLVMESKENLRDILKDFTNTHYNIICVIGKNGEIEKILSEREVINLLVTNK